MEKTREPVASLILYNLLKWSVVSPMLHTYFRGRIYGALNVPMSGPLVVVSNHASDYDPPILSNCMNRPVAFMAKEELFEVPVLRQTISLYGAYPVRRGESDRAAMRAALSSLEAGWATGLFLDGTRSPDGRIHNPKLGAALIAAKAKVPILPVSLWGTQAIVKKGSIVPKPVPVTIRIGEAIPAPSSTKREVLEAITQHCVEVIHGLHDLGR
ncbi:lysophospholipid acyltransferase family protein [Oscillatoria acuminata]|uniref:1-acyl-sn-glycerol-3-phosphate acyltransferase n=1 Tax=Oscillatoria acuminata PCC 6304 TaxID=56110 RepID=K9TPS7_9CYAN|nr:lysophospholipid acyltransferase family protein [Oscillatoria acuminata]AFY84398.1 1-acyl-sn-glycerol-3-phosphate acyltransferase [Oscillatoria acuminata PCC 6304]